MSEKLVASATENIEKIKQMSGNSVNLNITENKIASFRYYIVAFENMTDSQALSQAITSVINYCELQPPESVDMLFDTFYYTVFMAQEKSKIDNFEDFYNGICSGFAMLLVDGNPTAIKLGVQGFDVRSIGEPTLNNNIMGSKESFTESVKKNETMVRRRFKSVNLRIEEMNIGSESKTICAIVYVENRTNKKLVDKIRNKLQNANVEVVLETGLIKIVLDEGKSWLFSQVATTDRPDTLCEKVYNGRVGVIIDGVPFAVIIPYFFVDHFHAIDDYNYKTIYGNVIRIIRYLAYITSILLVGVYVALVKFNHEYLPQVWYKSIQEASEKAPFNIFYECLIILTVYEILREAGLRLPKEIGQTVSIVGSLVIGEAAVSGGIATPAGVLIVAIASIASYTITTLIDSTTVLRYMFVILGGFFGLWGIGAGLILVFTSMSLKKAYGIPFLAGLTPKWKKEFFGMSLKKVRQSYASPDTPNIVKDNQKKG